LKPDNLLIDQNGHLKLTDFGLSRIGFLDRRVRDELSNGPVSMPPSSPVSFRSGTPSQSPSVVATTAPVSSKLYKHSYFSLLFDQDRNRRSSLASSASAGNEPRNGDVSTSVSALANQTDFSNQNALSLRFNDELNSGGDINSTSTMVSRPNRQRSSSGLLSSGLITPTAFANHTPSLMDQPIGENSDIRSQKQAVGTPDYLAPESILGTGQDSMVDWWALGVICYEFLYGYPPFHAETPDKVFENILSRKIDWHKNEIELPEEAYDFMERLLTLDPDKRLGRNGPEEVRQHAFFKNIDWEKLLTESPSFVPNPVNEEDTDYFDSRGATMSTDQQQDNLQTLVLEDIKRAKAIINEQNPDKVALLDGNAIEECPTLDDVDFGTFVYKNLPVLEKANEDAIRKIRQQRLVANTSTSSASSSTSLERSSSTRPLPAISRRKRSSIAEIIHSRHNSSTSSGTPPSLPASLVSTQTLSTTSTSLPCTPPLALSPSNSTSNSTSKATTAPTYRRSSDMAHPPLNYVEKLRISEESTPQRARSISSPGNRVAVLAAAASAYTSPSATSSTGSSIALSGSPTSATTTFAYDSSNNNSYVNSPLLGSHPDSTLLLPLQISVPAHPLDCESSPRSTSLTSKPFHCLIADDNPISCKILETILQLLQCRCVTVRNGAQAIRCAMGDKVRFDFIFMDIRMPISEYL
jgi:serine/threonine-protein kinase RIM15